MERDPGQDPDKCLQGIFFLLGDYVFLCWISGGWSEWSEWSLCNEEGVQYRSRYCEVHSPDSSQCVGNSTQYQDCLYNEIPGMYGVIKEGGRGWADAGEQLVPRLSS